MQPDSRVGARVIVNWLNLLVCIVAIIATVSWFHVELSFFGDVAVMEQMLPVDHPLEQLAQVEAFNRLTGVPMTSEINSTTVVGVSGVSGKWEAELRKKILFHEELDKRGSTLSDVLRWLTFGCGRVPTNTTCLLAPHGPPFGTRTLHLCSAEICVFPVLLQNLTHGSSGETSTYVIPFGDVFLARVRAREFDHLGIATARVVGNPRRAFLRHAEDIAPLIGSLAPHSARERLLGECSRKRVFQCRYHVPADSMHRVVDAEINTITTTVHPFSDVRFEADRSTLHYFRTDVAVIDVVDSHGLAANAYLQGLLEPVAEATILPEHILLITTSGTWSSQIYQAAHNVVVKRQYHKHILHGACTKGVEPQRIDFLDLHFASDTDTPSMSEAMASMCIVLLSRSVVNLDEALASVHLGTEAMRMDSLLTAEQRFFFRSPTADVDAVSSAQRVIPGWHMLSRPKLSWSAVMLLSALGLLLMFLCRGVRARCRRGSRA